MRSAERLEASWEELERMWSDARRRRFGEEHIAGILHIAADVEEAMRLVLDAAAERP